jgi:3-hydroxyisobutyrate dehydrogenase
MTGTSGAKGSQAEKLGYLGLGMMGLPMAQRLLNAGHEVAVWNRSAGKAAALVEAGAKLAANPRAVAASASIIFMCVTDAVAVEDVVFGANGLAAAVARG